MAKAIRGGKKRSRGRPESTGPGTQISVRVHKPFLTLLDQWRKRQGDQPTRPIAMRRLAEAALANNRPERTVRSRPDPKAKEMAARVIDALAVQTVPAENRDKRKRRLLKGPEEFRDIRDDQAKSRQSKES